MVTIFAPNSPKQLNSWLWVLLLVVIALTAWVAISSDKSDEGDSIELTTPRNSANTKNNNNNEIKLLSNESTISTDPELIPWQLLKREVRDNTTPKDLFGVHSWIVVPPTPKVKPGPPPPPVAPPSPFTYFGKMEDGPKGTLVFLIANNKVYSVRKGEKIDAFWRFDSEDVNNIQLTYLPLNLPQVLSKNQKTSAPLEANKPAEIN